MLTQNVTPPTSAIEVSSSNRRKKTEHSEVLFFLSFPQKNTGIVPENGLQKFRPRLFKIIIYCLPNSLRYIVSVTDIVVKRTEVNKRGVTLY
jgi:hypothetical protein